MIAISDRVARDLVEFYHCRAPMHVIHHGVDTRVFSPDQRFRWRSPVREQYGLAEDEMVYLFVGDLRKGGRRCIQALAQLERGKMLFASRTPEGPYAQMACDAGVAERVRFAGPTNDVERFYAAADAFLLPTPYDAFGMVVSEAMASALPVIVSRQAGAAELIQHGVNGLLMEDATSVGELASLMHSLLANQKMAAALGCAARKSVEPMSWDAIAARTMHVYEGFLQERK